MASMSLSRLDDLSLWTQYALVCVFVHKGKECASALRCVVLVFIALFAPLCEIHFPAIDAEIAVITSSTEEKRSWSIWQTRLNTSCWPVARPCSKACQDWTIEGPR